MTEHSTPESEDGPFVEYCVNSVTGAERTTLEELPCRTHARPCLERCGTCRTELFAVVDGTLVTVPGDVALWEAVGGASR
ncbi:MAG: DUF1450 domain-containing protein [Haloarculaceae archaeon]